MKYVLLSLVAVFASEACTGGNGGDPQPPDPMCNQHDDCDPPSSDDAGSPIEVDAGVGEIDGGPAPVDAGAPPEPDAGPPPEPDAGPPPEPDAGPPARCVAADRLWFDDFETGDYRRWTGRSYGNDWGNHCQSNGFSTREARSGFQSHRSEIVCQSHDSVHRGYGGVQFSGDRPLDYYTNVGNGIEAPHGVVNTFWLWLDTPYDFGNGRWMSLWTTNGDCGWSERVITLGLEDSSRRITPAHIWNTGGTVTFSPGAPSVPLRRWARITVYVNYHTGVLHVWQDGQSVVHVTFSRPSSDICQWHWGAYASGDNHDIVLYEDDNSIWKLQERWTDFSQEPWLEGSETPACR